MADRQLGTDNSLLNYLPDLITGINPGLLFDFIKRSPLLTEKILRGYRTSVRVISAPVIRQRLIALAKSDPSFLQVLGALWIDSNKAIWSRTALVKTKEIKESLDEIVRDYGLSATLIALLLDDRRTVNRLASKVSVPAAATNSLPDNTPESVKQSEAKTSGSTIVVDRFKEERKRFKTRVRELESDVCKLESTLGLRTHEVEQYKSQISSLKQKITEQAKQLKQADKRIERLMRAKAAAEERKALAEQELKQMRKQVQESAKREQPPTSSIAPQPAPLSQSPDWVPVISNLLKNHAYQVARTFCETLTQYDPGSLHAHLALEHVYAKTGVRDKQVAECLWIARNLNERGRPTRACAFACRALEVEPENSEARTTLREVLTRVGTSDESAVTAVRGLFSRLRNSSRPAYKAAREVLEKLGKQYERTFEIQPEVLHVDKIIDFTDGSRFLQMSIRRIMEAVDINDVEVVSFVRQALLNLKQSNPALYRNVLQSLVAHDRSCVSAVLNDTMPVVVDGSNVAWHDIKKKPRLQNIIDLRSELRSEGYFPVYIYVDAALPHQVDKATALQQLIESGAIVAVESHTDADQAILEQAKRLSCPVVTNDKMMDWDPEDEVPKLRFAIDRFGVTIYDR